MKAPLMKWIIKLCVSLWRHRPHPRIAFDRIGWMGVCLALSLASTASLWTLKLFTTEVVEGRREPGLEEGDFGENRTFGIIWRANPSLDNFETHEQVHEHRYLAYLRPGPPCDQDPKDMLYQWLTDSTYLYSTAVTIGLLGLWVWRRRSVKPSPACAFD